MHFPLFVNLTEIQNTYMYFQNVCFFFQMAENVSVHSHVLIPYSLLVTQKCQMCLFSLKELDKLNHQKYLFKAFIQFLLVFFVFSDVLDSVTFSTNNQSTLMLFGGVLCFCCLSPLCFCDRCNVQNMNVFRAENLQVYIFVPNTD